ncbi:MAG: stage II sporulation protein P [Clostridia bacterium]
MKKIKINPILISCAIITLFTFAVSLNQSTLEKYTNNFNIIKAILMAEYGIYFDEATNTQELLETSSESSFLPIITQSEPSELDVEEIVENLHINDQTSKYYDLTDMLSNPINLGIIRHTEEPEILIVHTHGTESYSNDENYDYEATVDRRSTDKDVSIAKIASLLAENLNEMGITSIYCDEYHDYPEYNGSYDRSLESIESYLEQYPSIKMVIDVHRDAIIGLNDQHTYTTVDIDGQECAQIMMVIGTNAGGLEHDNWQDNLNNAVNLQTYINQVDDGLMKDINLRESRFNQHATSGSMLIEVGTSGNTLTQAINAIEVFSQDLAEYLLMY